MNRAMPVLALLLAILLVACGAPAATEPTTAPAEPTNAPAATEAATEPAATEAATEVATEAATEAATEPAASEVGTRTFTHKYGTTELTGVPERIVTVGLSDHDAVLALGVAPVGTTEWWGGYPYSVWPWAQDELGDAQPVAVGGGEGPNFEAIAVLQPDVILALYSGITQEDYDLLSAIAPTIAQPGDVADYAISWQDLTLTVGKVLAKEAEAQALIDDIEVQFAEVRAAYPQFQGASAVTATPWEGIWVYKADDPRGRFLTSLGFVMPEEIETVIPDGFGGNLSAERVDLLNTDVIVWLDGLPENEVYMQQAVHTEGREVVLSSNEVLGGATSFVSVLSLPFLLEGITPLLAAAVDGDPATLVEAPE